MLHPTAALPWALLEQPLRDTQCFLKTQCFLPIAHRGWLGAEERLFAFPARDLLFSSSSHLSWYAHKRGSSPVQSGSSWPAARASHFPGARHIPFSFVSGAECVRGFLDMQVILNCGKETAQLLFWQLLIVGLLSAACYWLKDLFPCPLSAVHTLKEKKPWANCAALSPAALRLSVKQIEPIDLAGPGSGWALSACCKNEGSLCHYWSSPCIGIYRAYVVWGIIAAGTSALSPKWAGNQHQSLQHFLRCSLM